MCVVSARFPGQNRLARPARLFVRIRIARPDPFSGTVSTLPLATTVEPTASRYAYSVASSFAYSFACSRALGFTEGVNGTFDTVA